MSPEDELRSILLSPKWRIYQSQLQKVQDLGRDISIVFYWIAAEMRTRCRSTESNTWSNPTSMQVQAHLQLLTCAGLLRAIQSNSSPSRGTAPKSS